MMDGMVRSGHGGFCCGITHVWNFPSSPAVRLLARKLRTGNELKEFSANFPTYSLVIDESFPEQTAGERLDLILHRIDTARTNGIVEAALISAQTHWWHAALKKRGFKLVNENLNSNSGNQVYVYHRNT